MGIQIYIQGKDMVKAGWVQEIESEEYTDQDDVPQIFERALWVKDDHVLGSYCLLDFCADCNDWGSNKALFQSLGLFDIPHILS